jgi:hypothetical protein
MRKKSFQSWLGLVFILLGTMSNNATASPNKAPAINCKRLNTGSAAVLRLKGAIDALLDPLRQYAAKPFDASARLSRA